MSLEKKLKQVATIAAQQAMLEERARVLWVMRDLMDKLEEDLQKKLVVNDAQRHVADVKVKIARRIVSALKFGVLSGVRPPDASKLNGFRKEVDLSNGQVDERDLESDEIPPLG